MNANTDLGLPAVVVLLTLAVGGCAGSSATNLYTLSAVGTAGTESQPPQAPPAVIAIGPVSLPDYLDRPQIVTRQSAYQLELAANDRWAAPLYDMLPRVLVEDLALRLPSDRIVSFPEIGDASFDYRVAVQVSRFDVDAAGEAALATRWQLYAPSAPRALLVADDTLQQRVEGRGFGAYAAALSAALADLGDRIARAVNSTRASAARPLASQSSRG
jgi:uncharacterized lipoprotein YmbA